MKKQRPYAVALLMLIITMSVGCNTGSEDSRTDSAQTTQMETAKHTNGQIVAGNNASNLSPEQIADFSDFVAEAREAYEIPGLAVAIVQGNEIVLAQGFGVRDIDGNDPVTPETLFHIGSTNKSITAMLIATLVDDSLIDWDTPVIEIVPDFALADLAATEQVSIRHLLSMSSGIPDDAEEDFDLENATAEDLFSLAAEAELLGAPGEVFSYSNPSSALSGYIGVLASGEEFSDLYNGYAHLLQTRVFDSIGMDTATLSVEEARANPNLSASHIIEDGEVITTESYDFTGDPLAPSGAIKASVLDMARYMITQVQRGVAPNGTQVVSEANLTETWQPHIDTGDKVDYALGWEVGQDENSGVIWHEGSYDSFSSILAFIPESEQGLVVLTNLDDPDDFLEVIREEFTRLTDEQ